MGSPHSGGRDGLHAGNDAVRACRFRGTAEVYQPTTYRVTVYAGNQGTVSLGAGTLPPACSLILW